MKNAYDWLVKWHVIRLFDIIAFAPIGTHTLQHTWKQISQIVLISTGIGLVIQILISPVFIYIVRRLNELKNSTEKGEE